MYRIPKEIIEASRILRQTSTQAEKLLWEQLRSKRIGYKFTRQRPVYALTEDSGHNRFVIPDFYCAEYKMIVELDGSIHTMPEVLELDVHKEILLESQGYIILRFRNEDIFRDIKGVINKIKIEIGKL